MIKWTEFHAKNAISFCSHSAGQFYRLQLQWLIFMLYSRVIGSNNRLWIKRTGLHVKNVIYLCFHTIVRIYILRLEQLIYIFAYIYMQIFISILARAKMVANHDTYDIHAFSTCCWIKLRILDQMERAPCEECDSYTVGCIYKLRLEYLIYICVPKWSVYATEPKWLQISFILGIIKWNN